MPKTIAITEDRLPELREQFGIEAESEAATPAPAVSGNGFNLAEFFAQFKIPIKSASSYNGGTIYNLEECPFDPTHRGKDAAIIQGANGAIGFRCFHNSCANRKWQDVRQKYDPGCYDRRFQAHDANGKARGTADEATAHREPIDYKLVTAAELAAGEWLVVYLVTGIMAALQPMIIGALQKSLKTSIALDLAIALSTAGYFLGYFRVPKRVGVIFMSGESGMSALKRTAQSICTAADIELASIDNLWFTSRLPQLGKPEHLDALREMLVTTSAKVLFIDPVYLAMPAIDNGNIFATGELLRQITDLCQELGVTLVLIHHLKRSAAMKDGPPDLSDLQWSGYAEWARQWILIRRREPYQDGEPHRLELYAGGSEGHGAHVAVDIDQGPFDPATTRKWDVMIQSAAEAKADINKRATQEKASQAEKRTRADVLAIVEAAETFPDGETKSVIRDKAGISATRMNLALAIALKERRLFPCSILKSNWRRPVEGFSVKQSDQSVQQSDQSVCPSGGPPVGTPVSPLGEQCPSGGGGQSNDEQSE